MDEKLIGFSLWPFGTKINQKNIFFIIFWDFSAVLIFLCNKFCIFCIFFCTISSVISDNLSQNFLLHLHFHLFLISSQSKIFFSPNPDGDLREIFAATTSKIQLNAQRRSCTGFYRTFSRDPEGSGGNSEGTRMMRVNMHTDQSSVLDWELFSFYVHTVLMKDNDKKKLCEEKVSLLSYFGVEIDVSCWLEYLEWSLFHLLKLPSRPFPIRRFKFNKITLWCHSIFFNITNRGSHQHPSEIHNLQSSTLIQAVQGFSLFNWTLIVYMTQ